MSTTGRIMSAGSSLGERVGIDDSSAVLAETAAVDSTDGGAVDVMCSESGVELSFFSL